MTRVQAVIFDLGGVVIDWDPRHLYRKIFAGDEAKVAMFLAEICPPAWNELQDGGRSVAEATAERIAAHPGWEDEIRAFYGRWIEMIGGPIPGTAAILEALKASGIRLFALSNWSAETFPLVRHHFAELDLFEHIFLSGHHRCAKPDARFYRIAIDAIGLPLDALLFVDDSRTNVAAAEALGLRSLLFADAETLRRDLAAAGIALEGR